MTEALRILSSIPRDIAPSRRDPRMVQPVPPNVNFAPARPGVDDHARGPSVARMAALENRHPMLVDHPEGKTMLGTKMVS